MRIDGLSAKLRRFWPKSAGKPSLAALALALVPVLAGCATARPSAEPVPPSAAAGHDPERCDHRPVIMVVRGLVHDRARLQAYGRALAASGLYDRLGAYYLNAPRPLEVFEGEVPADESILMVRFPCLAHARAFWLSQAYQHDVVPLRLEPDAGTFFVSVWPESEPPASMEGRVGDGRYRWRPGAQVLDALPRLPANPRR